MVTPEPKRPHIERLAEPDFGAAAAKAFFVRVWLVGTTCGELTAKVEDDPQLTRSRGLGIAATGSALTVIVGGAAWFGAGGTVATLIVPAVAIGATGLVGGFFWEAVKTMPIATNPLSGIDQC